MIPKEFEGDTIISQTIQVNLNRIHLHIQERNQQIEEIKRFTSSIRDNNVVSSEEIVVLKKKINSLDLKINQINEGCAYLKGFIECFKQLESEIQNMSEMTKTVENQQKQLKELYKRVMSVK